MKKIEFIDLKSQYAVLREQINSRIQKVLDHGGYILGPEVKELEDKLAAYVGVEHCVTVSSGTEALLIALLAIGIQPGDEVITTPFTFVATAEVIALLGAVPVFVDVEADTCNIDTRLVEAAITERTRAIIPVSLYGQVSDMSALNDIAGKYPGITVIEDAAQSFGATYQGKKSCGVSTIGCASFFPSKPLGCYGDGGAVFTNDAALAQAVREIRVHGQASRYNHTRIGVGGRMDTIQCAIVLAKLEQFDWEVQQRQTIGARYLDLFSNAASVVSPTVRPDRTCVWAQFTVQVEHRQAVVEKLNALQIPTAVHYPIPLHLQPAYREITRISGTLKNAENLAAKVLSLPMHPYLDIETQANIARAVSEATA